MGAKPAIIERTENLSEHIYGRLKRDIFEFRLLPGDRFTETEIAARQSASRTPVREALFRLQREGHVEVSFRSGWQVRPFDFKAIEDLYDVRIVLETAAIARLCDKECAPPSALGDLKRLWLVPDEERLADGATVAGLDERFHETLVEAAGNAEMARMHHGITERIRIVRHLDFTKSARIEATYAEHREILRAVIRRKTADAQLLLRAHIEQSKAVVRNITLHRLQRARSSAGSPGTGRRRAAP